MKLPRLASRLPSSFYARRSHPRSGAGLTPAGCVFGKCLDEDVVADDDDDPVGVPRANSASTVFNCMGYALGVNDWVQGAARDNDWPEEELLTHRGCARTPCGDDCAEGRHKVKLYEYVHEDQFHIVRQDHGQWSGKVGEGFIYDFPDPDVHTTAAYNVQPDQLRTSCWCCP